MALRRKSQNSEQIKRKNSKEKMASGWSLKKTPRPLICSFLPPLLPLSLWLHRWQDTTPVSFQVCKPDLSETPHVWVPEGATGVMELRRRVAGVALNSEEQSSHQLESGSTERLDRVAREAVQGTPAGPGGLGWVTPPGLRLCWHSSTQSQGIENVLRWRDGIRNCLLSL